MKTPSPNHWTAREPPSLAFFSPAHLPPLFLCSYTSFPALPPLPSLRFLTADLIKPIPSPTFHLEGPSSIQPPLMAHTDRSPLFSLTCCDAPISVPASLYDLMMHICLIIRPAEPQIRKTSYPLETVQTVEHSNSTKKSKG